MRRSFSRQRLREPRVLVRVALGSLLAANLIAALFAFNPFGDSAEDLRRREAQLTRQVHQAQARLAQTRAIVAKVERARAEGDQFLTATVMVVESWREVRRGPGPFCPWLQGRRRQV